MKNDVKNKGLFTLTWPIFIDLLLVYCILFTDAWFLSFISDTAAASVGAVLPLTGLGFTLFVTTCYAVTSVASQHIGASKQRLLSETYIGAFFIFLFLGACVTCLFSFHGHSLAHFIGLRDVMARLGGDYIQALGFGAWILALRYYANSILSSLGKTHITLIATVAMALLNITFNYLVVFIYHIHDVTYIALASVLSWFISVIISVTYIYFLHRYLFVIQWRYTQIKHALKPVFAIAVPSVLEPFSWHLAQVTIIAMVVQLGEIALATRVYTFNVIFIMAVFGTAISYGVQIKVAHFLGANQLTKAHHFLVRGAVSGVLLVLMIVPIIVFFSNVLVGIFTNNSDILALAKQVLIVAIFTELGRAINLIVGASLKASGDAKFVSFSGIAFMWLISVPACYLLGIYWALGFIGIALGLAVDELCRGLIAVFRWRQGRWKTSHVHAKQCENK